MLKKPPERIRLPAVPEKVQVVLRLRPSLSQSCQPAAVEFKDGRSVEIQNPKNESQKIRFHFDVCYDKTATQQQIFSEKVQKLVADACSGKNGTIFAYGHTSAGKTYTMFGSRDIPGMVSMSVQRILKEYPSCMLQASFLEIYNEKVHDLFGSQPIGADLLIREDGMKRIFIPGLSCVDINDIGQFDELIKSAARKRATHSTKMNHQSSRSHACIMLHIQASSQLPKSKLCLVDLAGSEDNRRSGNAGDRLVESGAINRSLFVLNKVINALNSNASRIPYRDSKLTRLLQDSLGGSSSALMVANIVPEADFLLETYNTLSFASRASMVVNEPANLNYAIQAGHPADKESVEKIEKKPRPVIFSPPESTESLGKKRLLDSPLAKYSLLSLNQPQSQQLDGKITAKHQKSKAGSSGAPSAGDVLLESRKRERRESTAESKVRKDQAIIDLLRAFPALESNLIMILNHGTMKQILRLKNMGKKRVNMFLEYRELFGTIVQLRDLVPRVFSYSIFWKIVAENAPIAAEIDKIAKSIQIIQ